MRYLYHSRTYMRSSLTIFQRLKAKLKQLRNSPEIRTQYHAIMKGQLNSGVIEPVDTEQAVEQGTVHHLPHREVVRMDRRTTI